MHELTVFEKAEFGKVRVVEYEGQPWFVASDVAKALGYANPQEATREHCKKVNKITQSSESLTSVNCPPIFINIIPESDVYRLVMRSNLPSAESFQDWVVEDVLPALRKTGFYGSASLPNFADPVEAARAWADKEEQRRFEEQARLALESKIEQDAPKVLFADSVSASRSSILIGDLAKILAQNGVKIGQNRLFVYLREKGFLIQSGSRKNTPTQRSMEMGLFEVKEYLVHNPDGSTRTRFTTKVTGKGQLYFVKKFLSANTPVAA